MFGYNVINGNSLVFYVFNGQLRLIFVAKLIGYRHCIACLYLLSVCGTRQRRGDAYEGTCLVEE